MVPRFESALLIQHAGRKAEHVRARKLPYVTSDFQVSVETDDLFAVERATLLENGLTQIALPLEPVPDDRIAAWRGNNPAQIQTLEGKLAKLAPRQSAVRQKQNRDLMIQHLLQGQNTLQALHLNYPELYESARHCKDGREHFLATESQLLSQAPTELLSQVLDQFKMELNESIRGLERYTIEQLVWEAVADWLVRCPLEFVEV
jgi:hypothetical protein